MTGVIDEKHVQQARTEHEEVLPCSVFSLHILTRHATVQGVYDPTTYLKALTTTSTTGSIPVYPRSDWFRGSIYVPNF